MLSAGVAGLSVAGHDEVEDFDAGLRGNMQRAAAREIDQHLDELRAQGGRGENASLGLGARWQARNGEALERHQGVSRPDTGAAMDKLLGASHSLPQTNKSTIWNFSTSIRPWSVSLSEGITS